MKLPKIIQGGMGIAISDWKLAKAVSETGELGVVSGTGIAHVMISRLAEGDEGGYIRKAMSLFPFQDSVKRILDKYFVPASGKNKTAYKRPPFWTLTPPKELTELTVVSNFVEVSLAKEGHNNEVGINLLEKIQLPTLASLYGAILAGVAYVIIGAGIPRQVPGILDKLARNEKACYKIEVYNALSTENYRIRFDPQEIFPEAKKLNELKRPYFLPIISSNILAKALLRNATGSIDGFVIEYPVAGGHNAPPRRTAKGVKNTEIIYGEKDKIDLNKIKELGKPFWLAGGYDSPEKLNRALELGAVGIQVGSLFALSKESGMEKTLKQKIIDESLTHKLEVKTDNVASPTGYPFKVLQLKETMSNPRVYAERERICDMGYLRQAFKKEDGTLGFRCPAEPIAQYVVKGGRPEETKDRRCLCNNLMATAGFPQIRSNGNIEKPIVTTGDGINNIVKFVTPEKKSYSAKDVIEYLKGKKFKLNDLGEFT